MKFNLLGIFILFACLALVHSGQANAATADYLTPYDGLLSQYVHGGDKAGIQTALVDYRGWARDPRHLQAMQNLQKMDPEALSPNEAKAFWINAYNLLTIDLIIHHPTISSIKDLGSWLQSPWRAFEWKIKGQAYTLDEIEGLLRKGGDPRIHMAIVCASLSCPDLRNEAYRPEKLDAQLDDQARKFFANSTKGLKATSSGLVLSPILKWYADDFGGEKGVLAFIMRYTQNVPVEAGIDSYFSYNWNLNRL